MMPIVKAAFTLVALVLALGARLGGQRVDGPPMPFVDEGACPFEGCLYRDWRAKTSVDVYDSWDRRAPVRRVFSVKAGEMVTAMTGVVVTTAAGRAVIRSAMSGVAQSKYFPYERAVEIPLKPGDTVYLLTNQGEGFHTAWFNQMIFTLDRSRFSGLTADPRCKADDSCKGEIVEYPTSQWWAKVRNARGEIGWTKQTGDFEGAATLGN